MGLPYENATSGGAALEDIRKLLIKFGCARFGTMTDAERGDLVVQFTYGSKVDHERKAMGQAEVSVCSILRDWIKGQLMAVETGILTFEGAFLGQILLPNGRTVLEQAAETLLPALDGPRP